MATAERSIRTGDEFENLLADILRKAGWRLRRHLPAGDMHADFIADAGKKAYIIEIKSASEGRSDRLIPLLSQAILQAQAYARRLPEPAVPFAVVAARRIPASVAEHLQQFAKIHAPKVAIGVIDAEGFRSFVGSGLDKLKAKPSRRVAAHIALPQQTPDLFSDLNQWMLKILLGQRLPEPLIVVPRKRLRNASQLAEAANVSVMSASRFVHQLASRGFLDASGDQLQIARVDELLDLWISANRQAAKEIPAHWIIKSGPHQLKSALQDYASPENSSLTANRKQRTKDAIKFLPRCCVGLFSAADALGCGFVQGVPPYLYLERLTLDSLHRLGLTVDHSNRPADIYIRIPANREAIFRPVVVRDGIPVSDILQVWLDVSTHPARGREQAREIQRHLLKPLFRKQR
jgi:Holliday junction resolvase